MKLIEGSGLWVLRVLLCVLIGACGFKSDPPPPPIDAMDANGDGDGDGDAGPDADPDDPDNATKDVDCDGLDDEEEFGTFYPASPNNLKTDPEDPDTDGDGILDGVEVGRTSSVDTDCGFIGDANMASTTSPVRVDTDLDTVSDGVEDSNHNGAINAGETNPNSTDTDNDDLSDGVEDTDKDGVVDATETDPGDFDTDNDGIDDGTELNVTATLPLNPDTDGDTCLDGDEDVNQNGTMESGESDPTVADCGTAPPVDTDSDGIPDDLETATGTNPTVSDTDGDALGDGLEDFNKNGAVDSGETNPRRIDTDCDGLIDGPDQMGNVLGEDQNSNRTVDTGESSPLLFDTDSDGIRDGVERGETVNPDATNCPLFQPDSDPSAGNNTDPADSDSDNDGISDGAEDTNQDGQHDPGELDPNDMNDGDGPAGDACVVLRPVANAAELAADLRIAIPSTFGTIQPMVVGGQNRGLIGYDSTRQVAFLAYRAPAPGGAANPTAVETNLRPTIHAVGALTNPLTQTFTTWDGYDALQGTYNQADAVDLIARVNALANALVGSGAGSLAGNAGPVGTGPFTIQAEYVYRSSESVVVLLAIVPTALYAEPPTPSSIFTVRDTAGGSALAQFADSNAVQCEVFDPEPAMVDFLFVVDDSGSMAAYQTALASTAANIQTALNNSNLDWRIAMVTTEFSYGASAGTNRQIVRGFTRDINRFGVWLTQNSVCTGGFCSNGAGSPTSVTCTAGTGGRNDGCWVGISGSGTELCLHAARNAIRDSLLPASASEVTGKIREGATVVVVILGDADDQDGNAPQVYIDYFTATGGNPHNALGELIKVHGIICSTFAGGVGCGETQSNPQRHAAVITGTNGIRGDIGSASSITTASAAIIADAINQVGYQLLKPPIGASIKVAIDQVVGACTNTDVPRSRINGFDFDGVNQTLSFFGNCRPQTTSTEAAVSYRYWIDNSPDPDGSPTPCEDDPYYDENDPDFCLDNRFCNTALDVCECPSDCGGSAPAGTICDSNIAVCDFVCAPLCGGSCQGFTECNSEECACECVESASCAPGYEFDNDEEVCDCTCSATALNCPAMTHNADLDSCSCVCKPDCGGCPATYTCNTSTCTCNPPIIVD